MARWYRALEERMDNPEFLSRRRFLRGALTACAGFAAMVAGVAQPMTALACYSYACCCLEYAWCSGSTCCAGERNHYAWYCPDPNGHGDWLCNECYDCRCSYASFQGQSPAR